MKKIFFPLAFILASCSDMVPSETAAVTEKLPEDFSVKEYVEINPDVKISQIAMDIKIKNEALAVAEPEYAKPAYKLKVCKDFLSDAELFEDIYLNYMNCPLGGWNPEQKCDEQKAFEFAVSNANYNQENSCKIKGCWSGGWEESYCPQYETLADCEDDRGEDDYCCSLLGSDKIKSLKDNMGKAQNLGSLLLTHPSGQSPGSSRVDTVFVFMCSIFNPLPEDGVFDANKVKTYLNDFWKNQYDTLLVARHFLMAGRYEGRAYRYCGNNDADEVRTQDMAIYIPSKSREYFWDYSRDIDTYKPQFFCLNKSDGKVYRIK